MRGKMVIPLFLLFGMILIIRTVLLSRPSTPVQECKPTDTDFIPLTDARLKRFQEALQFQTISKEGEGCKTEELDAFGKFIIENYPTLHKLSPLVEWERVGNYSLLYHIKGTNPNLRPYLLMSHLDVVPVTNLDMWEAPPFSGQVLDGFIYGRGAIDVKQCVMGILEAVEFLLASGIKPQRSFYIAFGHDEETTGHGAQMTAKKLKDKGINDLEFIADEGMTVTDGIIPSVNKPVACIAVSEKGYLELRLTVKTSSTDQSASLPLSESAIGILANAVSRLESNPHPSRLNGGVEQDMMEKLIPEMDLLQRFVLANIWLFKPVLSWIMSSYPLSNSFIRTTTAVTMFSSGIKHDVLVSSAEAVVNHRIHPSQSISEVVEYDQRIIGDERVKIETLIGIEPHPISGYQEKDFGYQVLKTSIRQIWPDSLVVPGTMVATTDTSWYLHLSKNIYRFSPTYMFPGDPQRFHGINERISVKNYEQVINFFFHLMSNADQAGVSPIHKQHQEL